jgi:hypothetical protein
MGQLWNSGILQFIRLRIKVFYLGVLIIDLSLLVIYRCFRLISGCSKEHDLPQRFFIRYGLIQCVLGIGQILIEYRFFTYGGLSDHLRS